jgi:hypothetical protein
MQVAFFASVMALPCARLLVDLHFGMSPLPEWMMAAVLAPVWIFFISRYTVQVRPDGLKLLSLWWLPWADVSEVRYWKLLGLAHFRVKRRRGFSWSIPLYFVGNGDLGQSIVHAAPPGNPFRLVSMPR